MKQGKPNRTLIEKMSPDYRKASLWPVGQKTKEEANAPL